MRCKAPAASCWGPRAAGVAAAVGPGEAGAALAMGLRAVRGAGSLSVDWANIGTITKAVTGIAASSSAAPSPIRSQRRLPLPNMPLE
jgi:hypothetical protein